MELWYDEKSMERKKAYGAHQAPMEVFLMNHLELMPCVLYTLRPFVH